MASLDRLQQWLISKENEHLEFKEAKSSFHFEELVKYCVALANEGGGTIVLGVTDRIPRVVVGSRAFEELERTKAGLIDRLHLRIEATALDHRDGRVLVFERGLDRPTNKALLLKHIEDFKQAGIREFEEALPGLTRGQIHSLLRELRRDGLIKRVGQRRGSKWELV